jgi:hypothetical protein
MVILVPRPEEANLSRSSAIRCRISVGITFRSSVAFTATVAALTLPYIVKEASIIIAVITSTTMISTSEKADLTGSDRDE